MAFSMAWQAGAGGERPMTGWAVLAGFRRELYRCLRGGRMRCSTLSDAVLCGPGRVTDLARLSLVPEFGRGHGGAV